MNLKHLFVLALLIATTFAYRKRDDSEKHEKRWHRRHQDKNQADLETKLAEEDDVNADPHPEEPQENLKHGRHRNWRRRDCNTDNNDGTVEYGNQQNDVKCERKRLRALYRQRNIEGENSENHRPRGWYKRANQPNSENNQDGVEEVKSGKHRYWLRRREPKNYNEQDDEELNNQNEKKSENEQIQPEGQQRLGLFHRRHPNGQDNSDLTSKWQKPVNIPRIDRNNDLAPRGQHYIKYQPGYQQIQPL